MRSQRVLILDDLAGIGALTRFFERFQHGRHYEVLTASNPAEAISTLKQGRPELIVIDPQMNGLDGVRLLGQIRASNATIPVIVVTGKQTSHDAAEVLKTGVSHMCQSPATSRPSSTLSHSPHRVFELACSHFPFGPRGSTVSGPTLVCKNIR